MDNTYNYDSIWDDIADNVESGLTDRLSKIDFEGIIKKALGKYKLKIEDIDWDSKAFQLALSKGLYDAINGVKKEVKADLGEFDIGDYMKLNEKALNTKIKTAFDNMISVSKEYGKEAAQEFTDEFFQAMTVANARKFKFPPQVKEAWENAYDDLMNELRVGLGGKDSAEYKIGSDLEARYSKASQTYQQWYIVIQDKINEYKSTVEMAKSVVNTIRQSLPQNASENQVRDFLNGLLESSGAGVSKTKESLKELNQTVKELGNEAKDQSVADAYKELFEEIKRIGNVAGLDATNEKLRAALEELKLIDKETEDLNLVNQGNTNKGGIIGEDKVVLLRKNTEESLQSSQILMSKLEEAYKRGVNVARIIDIINDGSKVFMEVQEKMSGKVLGNGVDVVNWDFLDATEEQIERFAEDIQKLQELGVGVDINLSNIFYDKNKGFGFIDLDLSPSMYKDIDDFLHDFRGGIVGEIEFECEEMNKDFDKIPIAQNFFDIFAKNYTKNLNGQLPPQITMATKQAAKQVKEATKKNAEAINEAIDEGIAEATDSHSPSVKAEKQMDNVVDGIIQEAQSRTEEVSEAGRQIGESLIQGVSDSINQGIAKMHERINAEISDAEVRSVNNADVDVTSKQVMNALGAKLAPNFDIVEAFDQLDLNLANDIWGDIINAIQRILKTDAIADKNDWQNIITNNIKDPFNKALQDILNHLVDTGALDENGLFTSINGFQRAFFQIFDLFENNGIAISSNLGRTAIGDIDEIIKHARELMNVADEVKKSGNAIGSALIEGIAEGTDSHSPSVEAKKQMDNVVDGLIEEAEQRLPEVESVGEKLGNAVKEGMKESLRGSVVDEDDIDAILGKKDIAGQLGYAIKEDNELPEWAEREAEQAIEDLEEMHQEAEKTEKAMSKVMEIWKEFGTPSDALDAGRFERVQEILDYLGGKFTEMNTEADDFSEHKLNAEFYRELIKELDLTEDQLTVVKGLIEDIYTLAPGGRFAHLYTPVNASKFIFGELDKIKGVLNGEYQITDKDIKDAKIVLESVQASVEETTQAEVQMDQQAEKSGETIVSNTDTMVASYESVKNVLSQIVDLEERLANSPKYLTDLYGKGKLLNFAKKYLAVRGEDFDEDRIVSNIKAGYGIYTKAQTKFTKGEIDQRGVDNAYTTFVKIVEDSFRHALGDSMNPEYVKNYLSKALPKKMSEFIDNFVDQFTSFPKRNKQYHKELHALYGTDPDETLKNLKAQLSSYGAGLNKEIISDGLFADEEIDDAKRINDILTETKMTSENMEATLSQICNILGVEIPAEAKDAQEALSHVSDTIEDIGKSDKQDEYEELEKRRHEISVKQKDIDRQIYKAEIEESQGINIAENRERIETLKQEQDLLTSQAIAIRDKIEAIEKEKREQAKLNEQSSVAVIEETAQAEVQMGEQGEVATEQKLAEETEKANAVIEEQKQKIVELEQQSEGLNQSIKDQAQQLADITTEFGNMSEKAEKANAIIEEQKQKITELEEQNESLLLSLRAQGDELQHAYEEQGSLQMNLASAESTSKMLEDDLNKQKQITAELEAQNEEHQKQIDAMHEEMEDDQRFYTFVDEELGRQKEIADTLRDSVENERQLRKEAEDRAKFYEEMSHMAASGEARADERVRQEAEARQEAEKALAVEQAKIAAMEQENKLLAEQAAELKAKAEAPTETMNAEAVTKLQEELEDLKNKYTDLNKISKTAGKTSQVGEKETQAFKALADAIDAVVKAVEAKTKAFKEEQAVVKEVAQSEVKELSQLKGAVDDVQAARKVKQQAKKDKEAERIKKVLNYYKQLESSEKRYQALVAKKGAGYELTTAEKMTLDQLESERRIEQDRLNTLKEITQEIREQQYAYRGVVEERKASAEKAYKEQLVGDIENKLKKIQVQMAKSSPQSVNIAEQMLDIARTNLTPNTNLIDESNEKLIEYSKNLDNIFNQFEKAGNATKLTKLLGDINQVLQDNSKMSRELRGNFQDLEMNVQNALDVGTTPDDVQKLQRRFLQLKNEMVKTGQTGRSFFGMIKNDITQASARMIAQYMSFQDWIRYIRQAVSAVTDLNSALTQLKIISGTSDAALSSIAKDAYELANSLGMSTTEVVSSITEWRRLGKTIDESMILAEQAAKLSTGGMMDINSATTALISSMQAFEMGAEEASGIVDQYIYLGNNFAISSDQLATSLTKSMAALKVAGNSLEEIEALEVAGNTIMQDADAVSNALKVLSMRLRGTTGSALEEVGEDTEGLIEDFSKLNGKIKDLTKTVNNPKGVSIVDQMTGGYKSTYKILLEISQVWKDIGDMQKAELLEIMAGKVRGAAAASILESPQLLEEAYDAAKNLAPGAGEQAVKTSMESIEKRFNVMKNNLRQVAIELLDTNGLGSLIDSISDVIVKVKETGSDLAPTITAMTDMLNLLLKVIGLAPVGGVMGLVLTGKKAFGANNKLNQLITGKLVKTPDFFLSKSDLKVVQNAVQGIDDLALANSRLNDSLVALSPEGQRFVKMQLAGCDTTDEMIAKTEGQVAATKALTVAQSALNAVLSIGISVLVSFAIQHINKLVHLEEEAREELHKTLDTMKESTEQFEKQTKQIEDYITKYKEYYSVLSNTESTEADLYTARNNLYDLQKDIIEQYDSVAKKIDLVNGKYQDELDLLKGITTEQRNAYIGENAKAYDEALESERTRVGYLDLGNETSTSNRLLADLFEARGKDITKVTAEEYQQIINDIIAEINDESLDVIQSRLANLLDNFSNPEWERMGSYPALDNSAAEWFRNIVDVWNDSLNDEKSVFNAAVKSQVLIKAYEKALTLNDSQYSDTYQALEELFVKMQEAKRKNDHDAFVEAERKFQALYNGKIDTNTSSAVANTYYDLFDQAEELINDYYAKIEASDADLWDVVDLVFKQIEAGFSPKMDAEQYLKEFVKLMAQEGKTWEELSHEIELTGYDIDGFLAKYKNTYKEIEKLPFSDWLGKTSSFKQEDKSLLNSDLLKEYESALGQFKDFLVNDREGQVEIPLSDILRVTGDPNGFFEAIGMPNFEDYMEKFGGDMSFSMLAYMSEVGRKVEEMFGGNLDVSGVENLREQMQQIMLEATGFDPAANVHKIEESYRELVHLSKLVADGHQFSSEKMDELIEKYPELKSGIDTITTTIDKETGVAETSYTIQADAIDNLVGEYATLSNEAIDAWRIIKKETLEASIANLNNFLSLDRIFELYHEIVDTENYRGENVFGEHTGEISALIREYEKELDLLDSLRKNPETNYHYKHNTNKDQDDDGDKDKDNKSEIDWLEQYLEKRNRLVEEKNKELENLSKVDILANDADSINKQLEKLEKGGNVNLKLRPEIDTEELNKAGWDAGEGFATVFSSVYSNEAGNLAMNFTPIIVDPVTGEYKGVLSPEELQQYAEAVIAGVKKDDLNLQIGAEFTGDDAIEKAVKAGKKIHKLHQQLSEISNDVESDYYDQHKAAMEEYNESLEQQLYAYRVAEQEYAERMTSGVLFDKLVEAAGSEKAARALVDKIMAGESINLEEMESELQSAITAMVNNWNSKRDAAEKQIEIGIQIKDNTLAQKKEDVERIVKAYDKVLNEYERRQKSLEHYQTMQTVQGLMQNEQYIIALMDNEARKLDDNIKKRDALTAELKSFIPTTEDELNHWYDLKGQIDSTTEAIYANQEAIAQWQNEVKKLEWSLDDKIMEMKYAVTDETDFLINTLSNSDMYKYMREFLGNDAVKTKLYSGDMSDEGLATLAMRITKRRAYYEQIKDYEKQIAAAEELYMKDTANTENLDRLNELTAKQREVVNNYNEEKQAILDLIQEGYDKQLESLQNLIDKYMEAVNAEKDLYDYQKNMAKQTKNIANLRKQMSAYANDTSEEARMKLQQLSVQLEEAEEGRADTEYTRRLQDQQDILDRMYQSLEDFFNDKMENQDQILKEAKELVQDNVPSIKNILSSTLTFSKSSSMDISGTLDNILNSGIASVKNNLDIADGDIKAVKDSVVGKTNDLIEYYKQNDLTQAQKDEVYGWVKNLSDRADEFNGNFTEFANQFNSQIGKMLKSTDQDERINTIKDKLVSAITPAIKTSLDTFTTLQGATLEKVSSSAISNLNTADVLDPIMNSIFNAYNATKSIDSAIQSVLRVPSNISFSTSINLDNVTDYQSFIDECKKSRQFENLIQTMIGSSLNMGTSAMKKYNI